MLYVVIFVVHLVEQASVLYAENLMVQNSLICFSILIDGGCLVFAASVDWLRLEGGREELALGSEY